MSDLPPSDPAPSDPSPRDLAKICEERARLLREYSDAAGVHANRVRELAELVVSGHDQKIGSARLSCRTAWDETEKSRLALYRHEADHECDRRAGVPSVIDP
jgi:hypothetical protein